MSSRRGNSDDISIRDGNEADLAELTEIYNHYIRHTTVTFDTDPVSLTDRRRWLSVYRPTGRHRLLVATRGAEILGYVTSSPIRPGVAYLSSIETSIYCKPEATGKGLGRRLYSALFEALRGEDLHRAFAALTLPNEASERLHLATGFRKTGVLTGVGRKFGNYIDVLWMEKAL